MASGFQTQVNTVPAVGVAGEFASGNPRFVVDAGPGAFVAGANGVTVGLFAWATNIAIDGDGAPAVVNNFGSGPVTGFVHREQQSMITTYLAKASMVVPAGMPVTLMSGGDFWVKNDGSTQAVPGQTCYASFTTAKASFAAASSPSGAVSTSWSIAAETASFTATISGAVMTVTGSVTGTIYPGSILSGGTVATNTAIVSQLTGTTGGDGTYSVSIPEQTVASATLTASYGLLTLTTVTSGTFAVGDTLTGATAGVTAGTAITSGPITGTGGSSSTFAVNLTQTSSSGSEGNLTGATNVATKWIAMSSGLAGEMVKIASQPLG